MIARERWLVWGCLLAALLFRLGHLTGPLDEPLWRQTDTAYMALRMMDEMPPDVLRPKAPYRGTNDVKAAEFPVYPALAGLAYRAAGAERLELARLITLLFFLGAVWFLGLAVAEMAGARAGWWTAVFYALMPLGIGFSRMVHPDFSIIFGAHLFFYGLLRFLNRGGWGWYVASIAGATLAFLMKAPYAFYFGLPVAAWVLARREGWTVRNFAALGFVLVIPLTAALWFNAHRIALEAPFEDSLLYPMKWTAESSANRFFGSLAQRLDGESWMLIARRLVYLIGTPAGLLLAAAGLLWPTRADGRARWALAALAAGTALYTLLVFPMVAGGHEYYSLPFMAPVAALGGWTLARLAARPRWGLALTGAALALLAWGAAVGLQRGPYLSGDGFFSVDWQRIRAGEMIREVTAPDDLVVSATLGRTTGWSDPRILYHARRRGWGIELPDLTAEALAGYRDAGARWVALLMTPAYPPSVENYGTLGALPATVFPLQHAGSNIAHLVLFNLAAEPAP